MKKVLYTIYDDSGDVFEDKLTAKQVVESINTILHYDILDADEEELKTLAQAKEGFSEIGYSVKKISKTKKAKKPKTQIPVVDVSEYYDNSFAEGGKIDKNFEIITKKIGFSESNANYLIEQSPKFAVWLADSILKKRIDELKTTYEVDKNVLNKQVEIPKESELKKLALEDINETRGYEVRSAYGGGVRLILDWLKHPLTEKQNLRELSFIEAVDKARIFHEELKVLGGDVDYKEPEEHTIIKEYDEVDGLKYYWVLIPKNFCDVESGRMGHCGRTGSGNELISLRSVKPYGKGHTITDSHTTIAYGVEDGLFYQTKGKKNQKPSEKYRPYIFDLIKYLASDKFTLPISDERTGQVDEYTYTFNGFGSEYDSKEDFGFDDMSDEQIKELYEIKPSIFDSFEGKIVLYESKIISEKPSTTFIYSEQPKYAVDILYLGREYSESTILSVIQGEMHDIVDSWKYHYENAQDYVNDLDKENEQKIVEKISEITKHSISEVKENGIEHYLSGDDEEFDRDDFHDINNAIAKAKEMAESSDYYNYLYGQIKSAFEEYGKVLTMNDEKVEIEIDLSDFLSYKEISELMKEAESNDLAEIFSYCLQYGHIGQASISIDYRYSGYADDKDFNENLSYEEFAKGGSIEKKRRNKVRKVMREFKQGELTTHGRKVTDRKQAIAIALSSARKLEQGGNLKENLEIVDEIKNFVSSHATITDSYVYGNVLIIKFEDAIPYFFDVLPEYLRFNGKILSTFDIDSSEVTDEHIALHFRKETKGYWFANLTYEERMLVVFIAEKFMGIKIDCTDNDCFKKVSRTELEKHIINNEKQMTEDARNLAYSILTKI